MGQRVDVTQDRKSGIHIVRLSVRRRWEWHSRGMGLDSRHCCCNRGFRQHGRCFDKDRERRTLLRDG